MSCVRLSQLHRGWHEQAVCARVSRMWHYRGGLENGPIKLMHMVLFDDDVLATPLCSLTLIFLFSDYSLAYFIQPRFRVALDTQLCQRVFLPLTFTPCLRVSSTNSVGSLCVLASLF